MEIDSALISRLSLLARLDLSDEEERAIQQDLNQILAMVEKLQELDTAGIEPLVYLNAEENRWREADTVCGQLSRAAALSQAPDQDGTYFKVPKVIDLKK